MEIKEISREHVYSTYATRIDCNAYWDSHGKHIPWEGSKVIKFEVSKKLDLYRVEKRMESEYIRPYEFAELELFIDGERLHGVGEITYFTELKSKVKLDCCVGAG